jgi:hypothetical protein
MNKNFSRLSKILPVMGIFLTMNWMPAFAASGTYHFEQIGKPTVASGKDTVQVKLVNRAGDKIVSDAVIVESKVYMGSLSQPAMTAPLKALPAKNGIYKFVIGPAMAGNWLLHLVAKVPGDPATVSGTLTIAVVK